MGNFFSRRNRVESISDKDEIKKWFNERNWCSSHYINDLNQMTSKAKNILLPKSTEEVANIIKESSSLQCPISVVAGGGSSANVATIAAENAIVIDLKHMTSISIDKPKMEVTVQGGTTFGALAEAISKEDCALPLGTGETVGVTGYVLNGGISGYFDKRLGMLAERVKGLTIVLADGTVKKLIKDDISDENDKALFSAIFGAGSALGVVTSITLQMEKGSSFKTGGQIVVPCGNVDKAKQFGREALSFLSSKVLSDPSVSMEFCVTADYTCISTFIFHDTFDEKECGDPSTYVKSLVDAAESCEVPVVANDVTQWKKWFDAASSLWPIIASMLEGSEHLARTDHSMGTCDDPTQDVLDFIVDEWMGSLPMDKIPASIVEVRTLSNRDSSQDPPIYSGNYKCKLFVTMIVNYDGAKTSKEDKDEITNKIESILSKAKELPSVQVDLSGCHSMADNHMVANETFGSQENYSAIQLVKKEIDPLNRFCCHPFGDAFDDK